MINLHPRGVLGRRSREDGIATSAIVLPGTVLLVVVALQAALWFLGSNVAQNAAVQAYRTPAATNPAPTLGQLLLAACSQR